MSIKKNKSALDRVFETAGCRRQTNWADMLGIKQSAISDAKKNAIPAEWLVKLLRLKGANPEWILKGLGPQKLGPANGEPATHVIYQTETKPPKECSA